MRPIRTIQELIDRLKMAELADYPSIIKSMDLNPDAFDEYASWEGQDYTRNCIERNENFELLLLCWNPGDHTPIHGHDGQRCWVYQIFGSIHESRYENTDNGPQQLYQQVLNPGQLSYMEDRMGFHVLSNPGDERSMSMHIYVQPIDQCRVYNESSNCFELKELSYDQIIDAVV